MAAVRGTAVLCLWLSACVGDVQGGGGGSGSGSGSGSGADASIDAPKLMWIDAASGSGSGLPCKQPTTPLTNGHHNTGKSCFENCHNHGFTLAGTLYTTSTSNTGAAGATVTVVDSTNQTVDIVVSSNGNFYTSQPLSYPVLVMASSCPSAVKMNVAVAATGRGCNTCHDPNAGMQMYLQP